MEIKLLSYLIVFLGITNLLRMSMFLVGSDIYGLLHSRRKIKISPHFKFSIIIPAHNEKTTVTRAITSIVLNNYPDALTEIIVVDDGSTDNTKEVVEEFIKNNPWSKVKVISQVNLGKASALNTGIKAARGELIMCVDADSYLDENAIQNAANHFEDKKVIALASNIKIIKQRGLLNLVQIYEYLVSYQMKRAESLFNCEYIIGGIGSVFKRSVLEKINYFDTNTVTEDIDLTMKILQLGNKQNKVVYGADVVAYTEAVLTMPELLAQRFRWKWGRSQTFLKNTNMFLSNDVKFSKSLSWFYLPFALFGDVSYLVEPILLAYIIYVSIAFSNFLPIVSAWAVIFIYFLINIFAEDTLPIFEKVKLAAVAPFMNLFIYLLGLVEYIALIKAIIKSPTLKQSLMTDNNTWTHVDRSGDSEAKKWSIAGLFPKIKFSYITSFLTLFIIILPLLYFAINFRNALQEPQIRIASVKAQKADPSKTTVEPLKYEVSEGDSLWKISKKVFGKGSEWNRIETPDGSTIIHPGEILLINSN